MVKLKNDYVFKRIFGYSGDEEVTKILLRDILQTEVNNIELDNNTITEKDLLDDKVGILVIKASINNNIECDIEMQVVNKKDIKKRLLFYWSKIYSKTIKAIEKAKEKLEQISNDEHEIYLAELREKYIRDQYSIEAYGYDRGKEEGINIGKMKGERQKTIAITKKMLEQKVDIELIKTCTGLTEEEINKLKEE